MTIEKTFDPALIEARWYPHWEQMGLFRPDRPEAPPFTIVIPPPNVTGSLHIGHALDNTLQDILVRHARLQGKDALWVVGTDHAGIATQMVVERNLSKEGVTRQELGRDAFIEKVWEWKAESGGQITRQLRRLGASCDWSREQFTMDPHFSRAVTKVFVDLYREELLYRDKRLVNWDPFFRTAISDLEVEQREVQGHFWHFRYPLEDGSGYIAIATTRPETILGDGAVAVHPDDDRYRHLVGKSCRLPIVDRLIPIIADEHVKMDFGSGAVKITAAHDWNDYDVYKRHPEANIPLINLMTADARMNENTPEGYRGLDRYEARAKVVADFEALGLLDKVEPHTHVVPHGDRSGVPIEPWLTDQWYVDAKTLAGPALEAVRSGAIRVVPETWKKTWYQWLENIQPWCVSRQLWWGHQIPAWYGPDKQRSGMTVNVSVVDGKLRGAAGIHHTNQQTFVGLNEADVLVQAQHYYGDNAEISFSDTISSTGSSRRVVLTRDGDVLDTWFSSALWPFATLGWPGDAAPLPPAGGVGGGDVPGVGGASQDERMPTPQPPPASGRGRLLARHYPNDVLVSGFDILFFWDARMAMQGIHFMGEPPWKTLYLHGLVRAPDGSKMSKSKGNAVDPLGLIDRYGADALRFTLAAMESQGRDIKLDEKRVEGYRNFATKLWNAARFAQANGIGGSTTIEPPPASLAINKWIIAETVRTIQALDLALADFRFDEAANAIYHFVWDRFCDWYLELAKGVLPPLPPAGGVGGGNAPTLSEAQAAGVDPTPDASREREGSETRAVAGWVLDQILILLHPFMPFVTEELWHALATREHDIIVARWPMADARAIDPAAVAEVEWLTAFFSRLREVRAEVSVPLGARVGLYVLADNTLAGSSSADHYPDRLIKLFEDHRRTIARMGRADTVTFLNTGMRFDLATGQRESRITESPLMSSGVQFAVAPDTFFIALEGVIDLDAERARLDKAAAAAEKERDALAGRLANAAFVDRAKPEAVAKAREDHAAKAAEAERLRAALARLG